ncbi:MAG: FliA/WhiG family RNA polymerase sigma factor [Chthoniobacteraceae bacterium]|nr:FliA/WhiG family RNA polymerase sigma factor [Chthoniobacteraceae bacterium]
MAPPHAKHSMAAKAFKAYTEASAESQSDFIERHLPLVKTVVDRIRATLPPAVDTEDLHSIGLTGLIAAARKYDPAQSATFVAFATLHIRGAVMDELRRMDWMSRGCREKAKRLKEVIAAIEQRVGRPASEEEICAEMALTPRQYSELLEDVKPITFVQLDSEVYSEDSDSISLHEIIPDETQVPARERLERQEMVQLMAARIEKLPSTPKKVLAMYYFENMRIAEIAAAFGVTEGRISQIHTQAILSLRTYLEQTLKSSLASSCC